MPAAARPEKPLSSVGYIERIVAQRGVLIMLSALGRLTRARGVVAFGCAGRAGRPEGYATEMERAVARADGLVRMRSYDDLLAPAGRSGVLRRAGS